MRNLVAAAGEIVPVEPEVVDKACCDAQVLSDGKATQGIPPAIRREVTRRDHGRCVVPGCSNSTWLAVHHFDLRSEGGTHDPERLGSLCPVHHTAVHDGRLIVDGRASTGFKFLHADGSTYGAIASPALAGVSADVFSALKNLGCKESEAKAALAAAREACGADDEVAFEDLICAALRTLNPAQTARAYESSAGDSCLAGWGSTS